MSAQPGRHATDRDPAAVDGAAAVDAEAFARPAAVDGPFAPHEPLPPSASPAPPVSPEQLQAFGAPAPGAPFAPVPGERIAPRPGASQSVPRDLADAFGATVRAVDGFDPAPGSRVPTAGAAPQLPWWKTDAWQDPWRDPRAGFWLGHGAVYQRGRPEQLLPELDAAAEEGELPPSPGGGGNNCEEDLDTGGRRPRRVRLGLNALLLGLVVALVAGGIGGGVGYWLTHSADNVLHRDNVHLAETGTSANRPPGSVAAIAARVGPAVVSIAVATSSDYSVGSGVVIDKYGDVLTNNHVIADAASGRSSTITVTFSDEATARAKIVGRDPISDLAVIKVPSAQLTVASLGDSARLAVGDPVIAIGSPLGLDGTVTSGIVSALDRAVHVSNTDGTSDAYLDAIQTDAAINPGNSGGALVDASGAVVGINSAGRFSVSDGSGEETPVSGIGYAIPIDYGRRIAEQLIESGTARHGSLDAQGRSVTDGSQQGAYLVQVQPGGAAARAGLVNGDVIVVADGKSILSYDQLVVIVQQHQPGDKLAITYFDGDQKKTATLVLGSA